MRKALGAALLLAAGAAALGALHLRAVLDPRGPVRSVETRTLAADYPADWPAVDASDPRLGDRDIVFVNHEAPVGPSRWDAPRLSLHLDDAGDCASADDLRRSFESANGGAVAARDLLLANGVRAEAWSLSEPVSPDLAVESRWIVFRGGNGRCYRATYRPPDGWLLRRRYERLVLGILGSLRFKPLPGREPKAAR